MAYIYIYILVYIKKVPTPLFIKVSNSKSTLFIEIKKLFFIDFLFGGIQRIISPFNSKHVINHG